MQRFDTESFLSFIKFTVLLAIRPSAVSQEVEANGRRKKIEVPNVREAVRKLQDHGYA